MNPSVDYIKASDGAGNASLMTVTNVRSPGATTLQVNTVANAPVKFFASMGTPHTFTDPVTGETITMISEATAIDFAGYIDGSNVEIEEIAAGYTDNGSEVGDIVIIRPTTQWADNLGDVVKDHDNTLPLFPAQFNDFLEPTGGVWSQTSGLTGAMTAGNIWYDGVRYPISAIASKLFTASKDTYIDINPVTDTATYIEVANDGTVPALTADSVRVARVITDGSGITFVLQTPYTSPIALDDVAKEASSSSDINKTNTTWSTGATVLVAVTVRTKIQVMIITSASSTSDTEYNIRAAIDGVGTGQAPSGAVNASGGSRYIQRVFTKIITLEPGLHTIQAQVAGSAGTLSFPSGRIQLTTSLASMPGA